MNDIGNAGRMLQKPQLNALIVEVVFVCIGSARENGATAGCLDGGGLW